MGACFQRSGFSGALKPAPQIYPTGIGPCKYEGHRVLAHANFQVEVGRFSREMTCFNVPGRFGELSNDHAGTGRCPRLAGVQAFKLLCMMV